MYLPNIDLHVARTLDEAAAMRSKYAPDVRLLAGGTDLLVDLKAGRVSVGHVVSLNGLRALRGLTDERARLRIGALTTITELGRSDVVGQRSPAILDAASRMAAPQIRNVATVGGNIACAVPCADLPPVLIAMDASVSLWSPKGERAEPLEVFFLDVRKTAIRNDEVLTAALIPVPPRGFGAAYARFSLREGNAIAVASVAAGMTIDEDRVIRRARIVLGAVAPIPKLVASAGDALVGQPAGEEAFGQAAGAAVEAAEPISDVRGSADFRRELVGVLTRRALRTAFRRAVENAA